jgi:small subunit ribosomal protein S13
MAEKTETRRIVRLLSTDVNGELSVSRALRKVKGVSFMFANAACITTGVDRKRKIGQISEAEVKSLEGFIKAPVVPVWMLNRRKDVETGANSHITMADLDLKKREDINSLKRMHCYKGVRHELGQPVRGQRTRSSFRVAGRSVGVSKKKIQQAAKPKPADKK